MTFSIHSVLQNIRTAHCNLGVVLLQFQGVSIQVQNNRLNSIMEINGTAAAARKVSIWIKSVGRANFRYTYPLDRSREC